MRILSKYLFLLFLLPAMCSYGQDSEKTIVITGEFAEEIEAKEMTLAYWENVVSHWTMEYTPYQIEAVPVTNGKFQIVIHPEHPIVYVKIGWKYNDHGFIEDHITPYVYSARAGDTVNLKIDSLTGGYRIHAEGNGAAAYEAVLEQSRQHRKLREDWNKRNRQHYDTEDYKSWSIKKGQDATNSLINAQFALLAEYKDLLDPFIYSLYKVDIFSKRYYDYGLGLSKRLHGPPSGVPVDSVKAQVDKALKGIEAAIGQFKMTVDSRALSRSAYFGNLLSIIAAIKAELEDTSVLEVVSGWKPPIIREKALAAYFLARSKSLDSATKDSLLRKTVALIKDPYMLRVVNDYFKGSRAGAKAYNFSLPNTQGEEVNLSDFRGKVVFIDFWYAGCGNCINYYKKVVRHVEKIYEDDPEVVFITVSIDRNKKKWIEYVKKGTYTSEDIINLHCPDGVNNPIIQQFSVKGFPHPLLIDQEGRIFSDSKNELRLNGVDGLVTMIEKAKAHK